MRTRAAPKPPSLTRHFIDRCYEVGVFITLAAFICSWFDIRRTTDT